MSNLQQDEHVDDLFKYIAKDPIKVYMGFPCLIGDSITIPPKPINQGRYIPIDFIDKKLR